MSAARIRTEDHLHQFIHRGTPKVLGEDDREALAEHLGCSPDLPRPRAEVQAPGASAAGATEPLRGPEGLQRRPEIDGGRDGGAGGVERRVRGGRRYVVVRRSAPTPRVPGQAGGPAHDHRGRGLDGAGDCDRRPHSHRRGEAGTGPNRHLRHLGRHGARRQAGRARAQLRAPPGSRSSPSTPITTATNGPPRRSASSVAPSGSPEGCRNRHHLRRHRSRTSWEGMNITARGRSVRSTCVILARTRCLIRRKKP